LEIISRQEDIASQIVIMGQPGQPRSEIRVCCVLVGRKARFLMQKEVESNTTGLGKGKRQSVV